MNSIRRIGILCVDDHPVVREGIAAIISLQADMFLAGEAGDAATAIELCRHLRPDVILMDLHLQDGDGIAATSAIRKTDPHAHIIALTSYNTDEHVRGALAAGAMGYLLKESLRVELLNAIRAVHCGLRWIPPDVEGRLSEIRSYEVLTGRELEVLRLMADGLRNRRIGEVVSITEETVKAHVRSILMKLRAEDRTQAVTVAIRRGIISLG